MTELCDCIKFAKTHCTKHWCYLRSILECQNPPRVTSVLLAAGFCMQIPDIEWTCEREEPAGTKFEECLPLSVMTDIMGANEGAGTRPRNRPPDARQSQCQAIGGDLHGRSILLHGMLHGIWSQSTSGSPQRGRGPRAAQDTGTWLTKCDPHTPH